MRFFNRNFMESPKFLQTRQVEAARRDIVSFLNDIEERRSQRRAPYDRSLITDVGVVDALVDGFDQSCAYCETKIAADDPGIVSHHRPRGGAVSKDGKEDPLYYSWLAYEWENLLPVCSTCQRAKRNKFHVEGERGKLQASVDELRETETAFLLDPCFSDISRSLGFLPSGEVTGLNRTGDETIDMLKLNRKLLNRDRRRAIRRQIENLRSGEIPFLAHLENVPFRDQQFVIVESDGDLIEHPGAVTNALLGLASAHMGDFGDLNVFLDAWKKLTSLDQNRLANQFLAESDDQIYEIRPNELIRARPNRNINLRDLPNAFHQIKSVKIQNFKALAGIKFSLPETVENPEFVPCMLVLGENATGKSTVLEAIALALLGWDETSELDKLVRDEEIIPEEFIHRPDPDNWDKIVDGSLSVQLEMMLSDTQTVAVTGDRDDDTFRGEERASKILLAYGPRRFFKKSKRRRFRAPAYRVRSLFDTMDTIANPIEWLKKLHERDPIRFNATARALRVVLMLGDDALIEPRGEQIIVQSDAGQTPLSKLSVGYKSVVAMVLDIARELFYHFEALENASAVVLIDEIETHLHPRWKLRIVGLLRAAFPRVQFIMTTHDPLCLKGMFEGEIFVLQRNADNSRIETLMELPSIRGMRAEQILTSEFFGLGSTDPETDAKMARYQSLVLKGDLDESDVLERDRLFAELKRDITIGDTLLEQKVLSEFKSTSVPTFEPLETEDRADRKSMLEGLLAEMNTRWDDDPSQS